MGQGSGTITASYSTGSATAAADFAVANAGGLVGSGNVTITASYSTGAPTANADVDDGTANEGGLNGAVNANAVNSYWDTDTSGIPATTTATTGVGTSTVALQAPTATTARARSTRHLRRLGRGHRTCHHSPDPWDFGGNWQYPVLKYGGLDPAMQRAQVTLMLSAGNRFGEGRQGHGHGHPGQRGEPRHRADGLRRL